jgi:GT2 family glycosyltransferase/ADP-heptose:LPS heptosyltransferase
MHWKYYKPKFDYENTFQDVGWPWAGHKFFAYDLVRNFKPKVIVELGTHKGTSFFSFCQAAKDARLDCRLIAVDTWRGDKQAGFYEENVIKEVKAIRARYYPEQQISLVRKTFDEAIKSFPDNSIDLLHIDGLHTYRAVRHDFKNWLGKVKDDGIIILHDIAETQGDFGVYKLWDEIKTDYKTLEFRHSHGLGIMFNRDNPVRDLFVFQEIWQHYYPMLVENVSLKLELSDRPRLASKLQREKEKNESKELEIMRYKKYIKNLDDTVEKKNNEIREYIKIVENRESQIKAIKNSLRWKVSDYFYVLYKKSLKQHVPKILFQIKDLLAAVLRFFLKYLRLVGLSWKEYRITGWKGLRMAIKRHFEKKNAERVSYPKADDHIKNLVTIGILTKDRLDLIKPCLESILKYPSKKYKLMVLIGDTGTTDKSVLQFYNRILKKYSNIQLVKFKRYLFSKNYNDLMAQAKGQYLIFLNNDTVVTEGWIDNLVSPLADKKIGIVGGKLLYKNGTIQHAGVIFDKNGNGVHACSKEPKNAPEACYKAICPSVTFACVAIRHDVFNRFKLDEDFDIEAQDTDFSFRLAEAGFLVLYNPKVEIFHEECSSRDWRLGEENRILFRKRWGWKVKNIMAMSSQRIKYKENAYNNSIVVLRDDGIGDLLMGVSAFYQLKNKYPTKKLILATYERNIEMMNGFGIFDEFIPIPNGQKYSPLPIPKDSEVHNLVSFEMKVTATEGIPTKDNKIHRHLVFSRMLGLDDKFEFVPMPEYPEAKRKVKALFKQLKINPKQNFVVLNLVSTNPARSWWEPYYPALIKAIEKMGLAPVVVGTKDSKLLHGNKIINLVGKTDTITEFIEVIKMAKYVISTDTSAYHIAALSKISFLAIFTGGVKPEARVKYYKNYEIIEPPASLKCYPCWDEGCQDPKIRWQKDPCCLLIKPQEVIKKFKELVKKYPHK